MWTDELKKGDEVAVIGRLVMGWSKVVDVLAVDVVERTTPTRVVLAKAGTYSKKTTRGYGESTGRILPAGSPEVAEIRRQAAAERRQVRVKAIRRELATIGWDLTEGQGEKVLDFLLELVAEETSPGSRLERRGNVTEAST